ncbi:MAG: hypothetical protein E7591_00545 [Ruminococcaceae bacterium]|nr:hypothetical protein [Oscillospiraceae bacterium]
MKKFIFVLLSAVLLTALAVGISAASDRDNVGFTYDVGDIYVPGAQYGVTPTIDGVISTNETYSDPVRIDNLNTSTAWTYRSRNLVDIDYSTTWDSEYMYIAAHVWDPTPFFSTFSPDNDDDGEGGSGYGGNGDVFVFSIDPLGLRAKNGRFYWESSNPTAWYSIVPMEDGSLVVYRGKYNEGDITDQVEGALVVDSASSTWTFEVKMPWSVIIADTAACLDTTVEELGYTVEDFAAIGADHNAMIRYMDRWFYSSSDPYSGYHVGYLDEGARFTISCNITVTENPLPDGTPASAGNAVDANLYGIYLHLDEGKVYTSGQYTYMSVAADTEAKIISYNGPTTTNPLIIPSTIDGKTVTYIYAKAFQKIVKGNVYIPSTVTEMETNAFYSCLGTKYYVVEGSYAHSYCVAKKLSYILSCEEHTPGDWTIVTDSTCSATGTKTQSCSVCGLVFKTEVIAKKAHTAGELVVTTVALCNKTGIKQSHCTVCGQLTQSITYADPNNHAFGEWSYTEAPFCKGGSKTHTCTRCNKSETTNDGITVCTAGEWKVIVSPTEKTYGARVKQCVCCNDIMEAQIIERTIDRVIDTLTIDIDGIGENTSYVFVAKGMHGDYRMVQNNKLYGASALRLQQNGYEFSYTVPEPGVYTIYIRFKDDTDPICYHVYVEIPEPEVNVTVDGMSASVEGLDDVKVIRIGYGECTAANIKQAEGYKGINASTINGADPYTINFTKAGTWTVLVEFNNGLKVIRYVTVG